VQNVRRFALAVFIPGMLAIGTSVATGNNDLHLAPIVFLGAQVIFYVGKALIGVALAKTVVTETVVVPATSTTDAAVNF
jgi:hypothetical protein